ncbi:hypothetical protein ACLI1X_16720, partial [Enterococcus faecalis]
KVTPGPVTIRVVRDQRWEFGFAVCGGGPVEGVGCAVGGGVAGGGGGVCGCCGPVGGSMLCEVLLLRELMGRSRPRQ